jgi:hypothetical protein
MAVIGINYTGANYDYDSEFDKNRKVDWDSLTAKQKWEWDYLDIDPTVKRRPNNEKICSKHLEPYVRKCPRCQEHSYFLNISDGDPSMDHYVGQPAVNHTAAQVKKLEGNLNMKVIAFFMSSGKNIVEIQSSFNNSYDGIKFKQMYGKGASVVNPDSAMDIAKELNKKFMSAKA